MPPHKKLYHDALHCTKLSPNEKEAFFIIAMTFGITIGRCKEKCIFLYYIAEKANVQTEYSKKELLTRGQGEKDGSKQEVEHLASSLP